MTCPPAVPPSSGKSNPASGRRAATSWTPRFPAASPAPRAATWPSWWAATGRFFDRIKPILDSFGDKVFYAGDIGAGSICKLIHNMIGHSVRQAIAEGLTLGVKAGVEPEAVWEGMRRGSLGRMRVLHEGLVRTMFHGVFEPASFALNLAYKDITLATELAKEYDVPMPITTLAEQITLQAMNRGWADRDSSVTVLLQEEQAGVEVRAPHLDPSQTGKFITTHPEEE